MPIGWRLALLLGLLGIAPLLMAPTGGQVAGITTSSQTISWPFTTTNANCSLTGTTGTAIFRRVGRTVTVVFTAAGSCTTLSQASLVFVAATVPAGLTPAHRQCSPAIVLNTTTASGAVCVETNGGVTLSRMDLGVTLTWGMPLATSFNYGLD